VNAGAGAGAGAAERVLERVEWRRWTRLRVLGLRGCGAGAEVARRVNAGRWTDVEVVGVEAEGQAGASGTLLFSDGTIERAMNEMVLQT